MDPLQVLLFGGFQLRYGSGMVPPMPSRAARSLFAYLVVNAGTSHLRERIAAEFWPDLPAARARRRLSHTLWQVQDALGEVVGDVPYLQVSTEAIGFDRDLPFRVDVQDFEAGLDLARRRRADGQLRPREVAELERTVELYQGEFLAGHYDSWIPPEQERLHQRYLEALSWLVASTKQQGAYDDALVYARRLTNEDPLREDGHREVMRLHVLLGRPTDAIRQYERCREVLSAELDAAPSAATEQLYARIARRQADRPAVEEPPSTPFPDRVPLVGRTEERATAVAVLERALTGRGGAVLVEGEAGIGTSRMLAEMVDDAHWRSFVTLHAAGRGPETMAPYTVVQDLLEGALTPLRVEQLRPRVDDVWLAEAAKLVPVLARALPGGATAPALRDLEGAQRMREALVHVLLGLTTIDPLAVVVDDLQWADIDSLEVLDALAGELGRHPAVLLVGYRGDEARARAEVWGAIRAIDRRSQPERVMLGPLETEATGELVRALGRGATVHHAIIDQLQRETGGNPLFLVETLRALTEQDQLALLGAHDVAELPLPTSIRALLVDRLASLPREVREILDVAAVVGDGVDLDLMTDATELPREVVVDAADTLVRSGLLSQTSEAFELRHHQVRRTALDELTGGRARALHRRVGHALAVLQPDAVERLAHHFSEADLSREAVGYLRQAADNAIRVHAYAAADTYLRQAIAHQRRGPVGLGARFDLLARHETVLDVLGERDPQRAVLTELALLADGDEHRTAEVARRRCSLLAHLGALDEAVVVGREAVRGAEASGDAGQLGLALVALGTALLFGGRNVDAADTLLRAAEVTEDRERAAEVRTALANVLFRLQRYPEAERELDRALVEARAAGSEREEARALGALGVIRTETGEWVAAADLFARAMQRCRAIGFRYGEAVNLVNLANAHFNLRALRAALDAYEGAGALFARLGDRRGEAMVRMNRGLVVVEVLGDDEAAAADLAAAHDYFSTAGDHAMVAQCEDGMAGLAMRQGRFTRADELLERGMARAREVEESWTLSDLYRRRARLFVLTGDLDAADAVIRDGIELAVQHGLDAQLPALRGLHGEIQLVSGDARAALETTREAVAGLGEDAERGYLVRFQHHLALDANGHAVEAAQQLASAAAELQAMVADLDPAERDRALAIPDHERIVAASEPDALARTTLRVARASAPVGRPLRPAELMTVTVSLPGGPARHDDPVERRRAMLQHVVDQISEQGGAPTVGDLADVLEVSQATVRRDLAALRDRGDVVVTRGHRAG